MRDKYFLKNIFLFINILKKYIFKKININSSKLSKNIKIFNFNKKKQFTPQPSSYIK
jgi:hypothetical protein